MVLDSKISQLKLTVAFLDEFSDGPDLVILNERLSVLH